MHFVVRRIFLLSTVLLFAIAAYADNIEFNVITLATNNTDPQLVNPWGIAASGTSPMWIGSNGTGVSELYTGAGVKNQGLVVSIPGDGSVTGVAFNSSMGDFNGDNFLFVSEDGTVSGWRGALGTTAEVLQTASTANVYKGVALDTFNGANYMLAANFRNGTIDVIKGNSMDPNLAGFLDPNLPAMYAPFDVQNLGGLIYVSYALQGSDKHDEVDGAGFGFVDVFNPNGTLISRLVSNGNLDAPWGMAIAPAGFGNVGGDLLVGNFGNGMINAYNPTTGVFQETLLGLNGSPLAIDGLWALHFGTNSANGGNAQTLYITAGPNGESGGLFAEIQATPEPASWLLLATAAVAAVIAQRRFKKA